MAQTAGEHELWIVVNALFPETAASLRDEFRNLVPQDRIVTFSVPGPVRELEPGNTWRRQAAEHIREHFLAGLRPDIVHVSSMVEGYVDDSVTSVGSHDSSLPTSATFYDAIPKLFPKQYLYSSEITSYYLRKLQWLKRCYLLLAISESSRQEAIEVLGVPADRVHNILAGIEPWFRRIDIAPEYRVSLSRKFGITKPFLMYSGAIDARKNIDGLLAAFAVLPNQIRSGYQLLIAGKNEGPDRKRLEDLSATNGLRNDTLVFTGFITDEELVALYNLCSLFILPSYHEGFGLPALEAMACGAPTIASNVTSLPEIVGWRDALFNPHSFSAVAEKIEQALTDSEFREKLRENGLQQAQNFTWESTARAAWRAFEGLVERNERSHAIVSDHVGKPRLAYFSPLPPERSGISDYSADLLPELARFYDIEVIVEQNIVADDWINANFPVRRASWFETHASDYDRILYQMGNSPFHIYMLGQLRRHPGVVVMHDFYLSNLYRYMGQVSGRQKFLEALFLSHGYDGLLKEREFGADWAVRNLPCNRQVIDAAAGVIVHSEHSRALAQQWYGEDSASSWRVIPLLRVLNAERRNIARRRLGISEADYLVCSFGLVDPTKLNHRVLSGWVGSKVSRRDNAHFVFVGENSGTEYGSDLLKSISRSGVEQKIRITGYASREVYRDYLAAADCAIQLRTSSRGETSAALLDCLASGIPTIVNAHGTSTELPGTIVCRLPDDFADTELSEALDRFYEDSEGRAKVGQRARKYVSEELNPARIAQLYRDAIESFAKCHPVALEQRLVVDIANMHSATLASQNDRVATARAIAANRRNGHRQLILDASATAKNDLKTGIERTARNITLELIKNPSGFQIEPIRIREGQRVYARDFSLRLIGSDANLPETDLEFRPGDIYLGLDWCPEAVVGDGKFFSGLRALNIPVYFMIYDLLPVLQPDKFPEWAVAEFRRWLSSLSGVCDGVVCISRAVADELLSWLDSEPPARNRPLQIGYFHLGADIIPTATVASNNGLPSEVKAAVKAMQSTPSLVMVGTLEPRKGHMQALEAFDHLWKEGVDANLVIVGHEGWHVEALTATLRAHPQQGKQLFWFPAADDATLSSLYGAAAGLLAPSHGEGFGLPLIEAARYGVPILARDLPVFHEVAGDFAYYFRGTTSEAMSSAIREWLHLYAAGRTPSSSGIRWLTWAESTQQMLDCILGQNFYRMWRPTTSPKPPLTKTK
jgi:glycosyltransferase involved in cell wall biosynthesis